MGNLYFEEEFISLERHYPIVDENGLEKYFLDQGLVTTKYKSEVSKTDGFHAMTIERTKTFGNLEYLVEFSDGSQMEVKKDGESSIEARLKDEVLRLYGDFEKFNLDVSNSQGQTIGAIRKESKKASMYYGVFIDNQAYEQILLGLGICIANMVNTKGSTSIIIGSSI